MLTRLVIYSALTLLLSANKSLAEDIYTLQLQTTVAKEANLIHLTQLQKIHSATFSPTEHFIYLGNFSTERAANDALTRLNATLKAQLSANSPTVVELFMDPSQIPAPFAQAPAPAPAQLKQYQTDSKQAAPQPEALHIKTEVPETMARQKQEEATRAAIQAPEAPQHASLPEPIAFTPTTAKDFEQTTNAAGVQSTPPQQPVVIEPQRTPATPTPNTRFVAEGYSIQVAAFKSSKNYRRFIDDHPSGEFYCNVDQEELTVIHMGVFDGFSEAKAYMKAAGDFDTLTPYIITLKNAQLTLCD